MWKFRWSTTVTSTGFLASARAADNPPNPAPTMTTRCMDPCSHAGIGGGGEPSTTVSHPPVTLEIMDITAQKTRLSAPTADRS